MANRHLSRSIVLQTLFEWDFNKAPQKEADSILEKNVEEFAAGAADMTFMKTLFRNVLKKQEEIDAVITKAAPDWPIDKISTVDRNILRIGLAELLYSDRKEVPPKVAINEAIELAKTFGGETSGRFVNGVLGAVYKEMGEPGKDEISPKKKGDEIPYEEMMVEEKAGAVVYAHHGEKIMLAFVHDIFGHWTLAKGSPEEGETIEQAAERKIKEELGIDAKVSEQLGENEYVANHPEKGKHRKKVTYFLAEAKYGDLKLGESGGLDDARWFSLAEIVDLNLYNDIVPIVTKAVTKLSENQ